jgi:hypothetical protein
MASGRHARVRESWVVPAVGAVCAIAAAVTAAVTDDVRWLRLAVAAALAAAVLHAIAAARAPKGSELREVRRELATLRSELVTRPLPIVEIVVVPQSGPTLSRPTSVNGNAYIDSSDRRRLVLDLVALEEAAEPRSR